MRTLQHVPVGVAAVVLAGCGSGLAVVGSGQRPGTTRTRPAHGVCATRTGFELSLVRDRGGQPTPVAAARWLARHGDVPGIPRRGWRLTGESRSGATVASHRTVLHAVQGSDGTWQVDSGTTCTSS